MLDEDILTREPLNAETAWGALREPVTPTSGFYTRNNYPIPSLAPADWSLVLTGFAQPVTLRYDALLALPSREMEVVLECAGNGRTFFAPRPEGTPWRERAVGCARFRGAPLADLLREAGVREDAREVVFRGADGPFERSLPMDTALDPDTLVAWEMNGEPLQPRHGAPVRLVVPGWYGVASVKWLVEARATSEPFRGHYQTERYVYQSARDDPEPRPVREKRVNSLVVSPRADEKIAEAEVAVRGWAWSGHAPIARVEISLDGGRAWQDATLDAPRGPHAWRGWRLDVRLSTGALILSRAHDAAGNVQPERAEWNVHGYGNNAPRPRAVRVLAS